MIGEKKEEIFQNKNYIKLLKLYRLRYRYITLIHTLIIEYAKKETKQKKSSNDYIK